MKNNWSFLMILMLIIASQLSNCSCNKDEIENKKHCLITDVDVAEGTDHLFLHLEYNDIDQPTLVEVTADPLHGITHYTYGGNKIVANSDSSTTQRIYELDEKGRVESIVNNTTDDEWYYSYDDDGTLIEEDFYDGVNSDHDYERTLTYAGGNCINEVKEFGDGDVQIVNYSYYLDKENKDGFIDPSDDWLWFQLNTNSVSNLPFGTASRNLVKTSTVIDRNGITIKMEFEYTQNSEGYVTQRTSKTTIGSNQPITRTTTLSYYCHY